MRFLQQGLVALDVRDEVEVAVRRKIRDFGDAVRPRRMIRGGHLNGRTETSTHVGDLGGVRRDHGMIEDLHRLNPPPDPLDQRFSEERVERFLGEPGRREPGGHDAEDLAAHQATINLGRRSEKERFTLCKLPKDQGWRKFPSSVDPCSLKRDSG
jgi:hypothetical protein